MVKSPCSNFRVITTFFGCPNLLDFYGTSSFFFLVLLQPDRSHPHREQFLLQKFTYVSKCSESKGDQKQLSEVGVFPWLLAKLRCKLAKWSYHTYSNKHPGDAAIQKFKKWCFSDKMLANIPKFQCLEAILYSIWPLFPHKMWRGGGIREGPFIRINIVYRM